jgi:hypothetical protein
MTPPALLLRRCFSTQRPADLWSRRRLQWLATGSHHLAPGPAAAAAPAAEHFIAAVDAARAARAAAAASARPIRIREHSILAALRDPSRLVVFNRPLPLPSLIPIMVQLWEEEALEARVAPPLPPR